MVTVTSVVDRATCARATTRGAQRPRARNHARCSTAPGARRAIVFFPSSPPSPSVTAPLSSSPSSPGSPSSASTGHLLPTSPALPPLLVAVIISGAVRRHSHRLPLLPFLRFRHQPSTTATLHRSFLFSSPPIMPPCRRPTPAAERQHRLSSPPPLRLSLSPLSQPSTVFPSLFIFFVSVEHRPPLATVNSPASPSSSPPPFWPCPSTSVTKTERHRRPPQPCALAPPPPPVPPFPCRDPILPPLPLSFLSSSSSSSSLPSARPRSLSWEPATSDLTAAASLPLPLPAPPQSASRYGLPPSPRSSPLRPFSGTVNRRCHRRRRPPLPIVVRSSFPCSLSALSSFRSPASSLIATAAAVLNHRSPFSLSGLRLALPPSPISLQATVIFLPYAESLGGRWIPEEEKGGMRAVGLWVSCGMA